MNVLRKTTATGAMGLGLVIVSFSAPGLAHAEDAAAPEPTQAAPVVNTEAAVVRADLPIDLPIDPPIDDPEDPPVEDPDPEDPPIDDPEDPPVEDPDPEDPPVEDPDPELPPVDDGGDDNGGGDSGSVDPGAGGSSPQAGGDESGDPALGERVPSAVLAADAQAVAPSTASTRTLPATGADDHLYLTPLLGLGLIVVGGVLLKRPRLARHRA